MANSNTADDCSKKGGVYVEVMIEARGDLDWMFRFSQSTEAKKIEDGQRKEKGFGVSCKEQYI